MIRNIFFCANFLNSYVTFLGGYPVFYANNIFASTTMLNMCHYLFLNIEQISTED